MPPKLSNIPPSLRWLEHTRGGTDGEVYSSCRGFVLSQNRELSCLCEAAFVTVERLDCVTDDPVINVASTDADHSLCRRTTGHWYRSLTVTSLHFAWVEEHEKCIVVTRVCLCVCVCLSAAACLQYCTDLDVTWGNGRGCPLVVHYWADLQSVHGLCCYGNIMEMRGRAQR